MSASNRSRSLHRTKYIKFYHLRTYDRINAPPSLIREMEHHSGRKFHEAQVALTAEWLGPPSNIWHQDKVEVRVPLPSKSLEGDTGKTKVESFPLPANVDEGRRIIDQFHSGATRRDTAVADNVGQHVQHDRTSLMDEGWLGTAEEERAA